MKRHNEDYLALHKEQCSMLLFHDDWKILRAGDVIFLGSPAVAVPARPGALELHGPQESVLSALIKE